MKLNIFIFAILFFICVPILHVLVYAIYSIQSVFFGVELWLVGWLFYIAGFVLIVYIIFRIFKVGIVAFAEVPLFPNIVIYSACRILNLIHLDTSGYLWLEFPLSLVLLYCALQYTASQYVMSKMRWIRRKCRLLLAVVDDISQVQSAKDQRVREVITQQLTKEEKEWAGKIREVFGPQEDYFKNLNHRTTNLLRRQLLFLQLPVICILQVGSQIAFPKGEFSIVKGICQKLEKSRSKLQSTEDMLDEDESGSASRKQLTDQVISILKKINRFNGSHIEKLQSKLELLVAFLKDVERAELESVTEKAWFEEMKILLDDIDKAFNTFFSIIYIKITDNLSEAEADWMADGLIELLDAKSKYGLRFIRTQQKTHPALNSEHLILTAVKIRDHPNLQQISFDEEAHEIKSHCNWLEKMHGNLREIEGASNFRLVCLKRMTKIARKLKEGFENYNKYGPDFREFERLIAGEDSYIKNQISDIEIFIGAYDFKVRPKSSSIFGLEEDRDALVSKLTTGSEQCCVISIAGMQGIGKTTLAKRVYHHKQVLSNFPIPKWVSLPRDFNDVDALMEHVQYEIIGTNESQQPDNWKGKEHCIQKIQSFLQAKYLVVLDNVSTMMWDTLKYALPEKRNGSRILLTTRDKTVASDVESKELLQLRLRTEKESWELFLQKARFPPELLSPDEISRKAKDVVRSCWGLPLTLSRLGFFTAGESVDSVLLSSASEQVDQSQQTVWSETSKFNVLPDHLKRLVSYFTLFPKSFEIPARRMVALWVAEGLVQPAANEKNTLEKVAEYCLLELIGLNIIQPVEKNVNGKVKTICFPNPLRDGMPSTSASSDQQRLADHNHHNDKSFGLIHDAESDTHSPNEWKDYKKLVSLISFDAREGDKPGNDIGNFLHKGIANGCFKMLKVLDLERVFRPQLPKTIGKLIELRYLGLRWTYLEEIPSTVGNLSNLQTLDLKHTYIRTLPNTIWKLHQLQHLYLNQIHRSRFVHQSKTRSFNNLQTLWGVFLDENSPLKDSIDELKSLRKLELAFQLSLDQQKDLIEKISNLEHLQSLRLRSVGVMSEPEDLYMGNFFGFQDLSSMYLFGRLEIELLSSNFPNHLSDVILSAFQLQRDPMPVLEKLPNLRSVSLFSDTFTGESMVCSREGFPQLLVLKIWKLSGLKNWNIEEQTMQKLRDLEIRSCPQLKFPDGLGHLKALQQLKLKNMSEDFMEDIPSSPSYQLLIN